MMRSIPLWPMRSARYLFIINRMDKNQPNLLLHQIREFLWFAIMAIGIQIKELADPPAVVFGRMILTSCGAC